MTCPTTPEELAEALREGASKRQAINVCGRNTKSQMAGPITPSDLTISTARLTRILEYEPRDLTISVESGLPYSELRRALAEHRQMIPLDPPFAGDCTIGGVIASNLSGPRRRLHGTARDMVIGMKFATLDGKLVQSGGMVVKNVAGLDMAKLMIGSFGTLAAMAVINFKLTPLPPETRTFVQEFPTIGDVIAARDAIQKGVLQPSALDIVKRDGRYRLLAQAAGNPAVLDRYARELSGAEIIEGDAEQALWTQIREMTPAFMSTHPDGAVVRVSSKLSDVGTVLANMPPVALARAGTGVCYGYFENWRDAIGRGIVEFGPEEARNTADLWPSPGSDFAIMKKVKSMFDPQNLLNRGRLYGRL